VKIKSSILISMFSLTLHAANPPLHPKIIVAPNSIPQHFTSEHTFKLDSSNPGPFVIRLESVHTLESPTLDRATNAYLHTASPFATLGPVVIGLASFYCGWKLSQVEKPQIYHKVLSCTLMAFGFLAACAPFILYILQSRSISV
jgi:hypothetical protein